MARPVLERAIERCGWSVVDAAIVDDFLAIGGKCILFFSGDSSKRPEADDVAVILPELQNEFNQAFRVGVVPPEAFQDLKERFKVHFLPTLCLIDNGAVVGNIVRIQNWAEYHSKIGAFVAQTTSPATETEHA